MIPGETSTVALKQNLGKKCARTLRISSTITLFLRQLPVLVPSPDAARQLVGLLPSKSVVSEMKATRQGQLYCEFFVYETPRLLAVFFSRIW